MRKRYLLPLALILMILLAACSGGQTAEVSQAEVAAVSQDAAPESMEEENNDGDMEAMEEDSHNEEMAEESQDEDMEAMEGQGHDDDMAEETPEEEMEGQGHDEDMAEESSAADIEAMDNDDHEDEVDKDAEMADDAMAVAGLPAWQTIALANATTGEQFTLADFQGKTVFVEPMATWCSNCRAQQGHVQQAKAQLGDEAVFIGLSLETTLPAGELASYAQGNGFDWTYAVMPVELLAELSDEFGRSITSAPSTPHFIIRPDGSFSELATGIHSADEIIAEIQAQ